MIIHTSVGLVGFLGLCCVPGIIEIDCEYGLFPSNGFLGMFTRMFFGVGSLIGIALLVCYGAGLFDI